MAVSDFVGFTSTDLLEVVHHKPCLVELASGFGIAMPMNQGAFACKSCWKNSGSTNDLTKLFRHADQNYRVARLAPD